VRGGSCSGEQSEGVSALVAAVSLIALFIFCSILCVLSLHFL